MRNYRTLRNNTGLSIWREHHVHKSLKRHPLVGSAQEQALCTRTNARCSRSRRHKTQTNDLTPGRRVHVAADITCTVAADMEDTVAQEIEDTSRKRVI